MRIPNQGAVSYLVMFDPARSIPPAASPPPSPVHLFRVRRAGHFCGLCAAPVFLFVAANGCSPMLPTPSVVIPPLPLGEARIWFCRDYEPYADKGGPLSRSTAHIPVSRSLARHSTAMFLRATIPQLSRATVSTLIRWRILISGLVRKIM